MTAASLICGIIALAGTCVWICYRYFYKREDRLVERLMQMIEQAETGMLVRQEISEEKFSALEDQLKRYLDGSMLESGNQKQQKEIVQELISDIAHQTLTPIANLELYSQLLHEKTADEAEVLDIVETIQEQTQRLSFQIQSLVKLSRLEGGMISVVPRKNDIQTLFEALEKEYKAKADAKGIELVFEQSALRADFDMKWTVEAVGNIVDNAVKYTKDGGKVLVGAQTYTFFVRIDISDNGIGIAQEECAKIFARFYRSFEVADEPGVGIGLYLARELIQAQKGYIKVKAEKGKGCLFSVFLPAGKQ